MTTTATTMPQRILHTMLRVRDLEASVHFYTALLGMRELRRQRFEEGRFTLSFIGYGKEDANTVLELTHNWDEQDYEMGTAWGHIALEVDNISAVVDRLRGQGVPVLREAGPMRHASDDGEIDVIAFIADPDGYRIELIERDPGR